MNKILPSSFRDPSGFVFIKNKVLYRQVNPIYKTHYESLMQSGLYQELTSSLLLIPHKEISPAKLNIRNAYKIIEPDKIPFISYPYEWSFSELQDAACTILEIQKKSLDFGMVLKDASAYNIQFIQRKPTLIDTLSFEKYKEGQPWVAYRQFCQHFLAPLALMSIKDVRLNQILSIYLDGIPLDLASTLLPLKTYFKFPLLSHIHLHARSQKYYADKAKRVNRYKVNRLGLLGLIESLKSSIQKLKPPKLKSQWLDYYQQTNYSQKAFENKKRLVLEFLQKSKPKIAWDLGANTGIFSRMAAEQGAYIISIDNDPLAVEFNYLECKKRHEVGILPLVIDLINPSPSIGWANQERISLIDRGPADLVLALALIHHLAIGNNLPFEKIAQFFSLICNFLIIEFIPKEDNQCQRLLAGREDIFFDYSKEAFEKEFCKYFIMTLSKIIKDTKRVMYLMKKK